MDDCEIIKLFCVKSESAISETMKKYGRYIYCIGLRITGKHEDAEECLNDSLFILWNRIPQSPPHSLLAYICTIANHVALGKMDYYHAAKRDCNRTVTLDENSMFSSGNNIDEYIEGICIEAAFQKFISELSLEKQYVFKEKYINLKTIDEISGLYGMSQSKVKMMLCRMRRELKKRLEEENIYI